MDHVLISARFTKAHECELKNFTHALQKRASNIEVTLVLKQLRHWNFNLHRI